MPKASTARARLPRGTKPVIQAFFDALDAIPDASRAEVAKAAHAGIRDALKAEREQAKQERAREGSAGARGRKTGKAKPADTGRGRGKVASSAPKRAPRPAARPAKRRARTTARTRDNEPFEEPRDTEQSGDDSELSAAAETV